MAVAVNAVVLMAALATVAAAVMTTDVVALSAATVLVVTSMAAKMLVLALIIAVNCMQLEFEGDVDPVLLYLKHREQALCPDDEYFPALHVKQAPDVTAPVQTTV